ncbi:MAG: aminopeptidase [Gemmatimonadetes bacterium]|nr:aminopeptidase [Gemmatimonadota bacterium]
MRRLLVPALLAVALAACSPIYILRAGIAEAGILSRRRPIAALVEDPTTPPETRRKLQVVQRARAFAEHGLGLRVGESYTTYSTVEHDTLMLVLSAAPKLEFRPYTWWFPIVGRVPYKGFFDPDDAKAAARSLEAEGYDAYIRPTSAFSTLGWFNDPLLNTVLRYDDVDLTNTIIHELTHNTIYIPSRVEFNESFANFVGGRGAIDYYCGVEGEDGERCRLARARWADELLFGDFLTTLVHDLQAVYARTDLPPERRLALRAQVFRDARTHWARDIEPHLQSDQFRGFGQRAILNNASLIARRLYYDRLRVFEAAYQRLGQDLPRTIREVKRAAERAKDPYQGVAAIAG